MEFREEELRMLCAAARDVFMGESMLLEVEAPLNICGDLHGQYPDLLRIFRQCGRPPDVQKLYIYGILSM